MNFRENCVWKNISYGREDPDISLVKNKSDCIHPNTRNAALERYIENVQNTPTTKSNQNIQYNVSLPERNAIKSLANDQSIIIKEADKGGTVVIMDRENYKEIVKTMLSNEEYYKELHTDPQKTDRIKYNKFLKKYKDNLTQKEMDYLTNFEMKPSNFYGSPKVHKMTKSGMHVNKK